MAEIKATVRVEGHVTLHLSEVEAAALEAIVGYGTDSFLRVFYAQMGKHYLQPHEAGVKSLFETIKRDVPHALSRFKAARLAFMMPSPHGATMVLEAHLRAEREKAEMAAAQLRSKENKS